MMPLSYHCLTLAAIAFSTMATLPASAQTVTEDIKFLADDTSGGDEFGSSVAISGNTIIIGAPRKNQNRGAAYLFDRVTGQQLFKLTADDGESHDSFGWSVAISGTTALVGATQDDDLGLSSGSVYMFDTKTGLQTGKLHAEDGADSSRFGTSIAISGTTAIVGSILAENPGEIYAGSVYLFDTETGLQTAQFFPSNPEAYLYFGSAVAISDTTAIIGAPSFQVGSGAVYIFDLKTGLQTALFTGTQGQGKYPGEALGESVAISDTTAIVGAPRFYDSVSRKQSGTVYLYDTQTGLQTGQLFPSDQRDDMWFGQSVMVSGSTIVVGASGINDRTGAAYLFDLETGQQLAKLVASDRALTDEFGHHVAISGSTAIIGASFNDGRGPQTGSAYIFDFAPKIQQQPLGLIVSDGDTAEFTVTIPDETGVDFLWRRNGIDLIDEANISGTQSSSLQIVASEYDEAYYDCVITNRYGPTLTHPVVLGIMTDPNACEADLNNDGVLNFFDVSQFIVNFSRGCP